MPAGGRNMLKFAPFTTLLLLILAPSLLAEKSKCDVCKDMTKHFMEVSWELFELLSYKWTWL